MPRATTPDESAPEETPAPTPEPTPAPAVEAPVQPEVPAVVIEVPDDLAAQDAERRATDTTVNWDDYPLN